MCENNCLELSIILCFCILNQGTEPPSDISKKPRACSTPATAQLWINCYRRKFPQKDKITIINVNINLLEISLLSVLNVITVKHWQERSKLRTFYWCLTVSQCPDQDQAIHMKLLWNYHIFWFYTLYRSEHSQTVTGAEQTEGIMFNCDSVSGFKSQKKCG